MITPANLYRVVALQVLDVQIVVNHKYFEIFGVFYGSENLTCNHTTVTNE